jgi:hypothetical protein
VKRTILTLVAGVALGAAAVAVPALSSSGSSARSFYPRIGDNVLIRSVDLFCTIYRRDPDRIEAGPLVECGRWSVRGGGRRMRVSRYHYIVSTANGRYVAYRVTRSP